MIHLSTDKGIVNIESWSDIEELPGFKEEIDPSKVELSKIIGSYQFDIAHRIKCGLSNCHTEHGKGYLIETKDGSRTNIGHICGKTHFSVEFVSLSKRFDRDLEMKTFRERLSEIQNMSQSYHDEIESIRDSQYGGRDWVYHKCQAFLNKGKGLPDIIINQIAKMIKTQDSQVYKLRLATDKEIEVLEETEKKKLPRPHYIDELAGFLSGLPALYPENDLRNLLILDLNNYLKKLISLSIDSLSYSELKENAKLASEIAQKIERIKTEVIHSGNFLLKKENIQLLEVLLDDQKDKNLLKKFVKKLPD